MGGKIKEQQKARALRIQGKSLNEITSQLNVAKSSVSLWVRNVQLTKSQQQKLKQRSLIGAAKGRRKILKKWREYRKLHPRPIPQGPRWPKRLVETFFDIWTPEMAYVLGYFAADGCMYINRRGSHYIHFTSIDLELIQKAKQLMAVSNEIELGKSRNQK